MNALGRELLHSVQKGADKKLSHPWNPPRHHEPAPGKCDLRHVLGAGQ